MTTKGGRERGKQKSKEGKQGLDKLCECALLRWREKREENDLRVYKGKDETERKKTDRRKGGYINA